MVFPLLLWPSHAAFSPKHTRACSLAAPTSLPCSLRGLLDLVDGPSDDLLDLAYRLVGPALRAKLVVASQRAGGFLQSAFRHVCLAEGLRHRLADRVLNAAGFVLVILTHAALTGRGNVLGTSVLEDLLGQAGLFAVLRVH